MEQVYERIVSLFANERGLLLHSLKTDVYLQVFVEEARRHRKKKKPGLCLTPMEIEIATALNLSSQELDQASNELLSDLTFQGLSSPYNVNDIMRSLDNNNNTNGDNEKK